MGDEVNAEDINSLKTDRGNEKFFFKLRDLKDLKQTFDNMIGTVLFFLQCTLLPIIYSIFYIIRTFIVSYYLIILVYVLIL